MTTEKIKQLSNLYFEEMKNIRHKIHQYPELGFQEHKTSALVEKTLMDMGINDIQKMAATGIVALIKGKNPGKTVLLRADMDALEIQEEADVPYCSLVPNRMHACGHDGHTAALLGAAMILQQLKEEFDGNIKLVFQPAEESDGGALPMIKSGVMENPKVDCAFGCHLWGSIPEGFVHLKKGPMMAAPDDFRFKIIGKAGHGGMPHLTVDPIVICSQAILSMQTIVSRKLNPLMPVVISTGSIHGGESHNIIPGSVEVVGTVRSFDESIRKEIPKEMEKILKAVTEAYGASYTFDYNFLFPPLINDDSMVDLAASAFEKFVGENNVSINGEMSMGGEDFSFFSKEVPSAFIFVGISKDPDKPVLHHHPLFQWDDENLKIIAQGLSQTAIDYLNKGA